MKTEFFIPMIPPTVTQQEHKVTVVNGKPKFYDPPELKAAKLKLESHLAKHRPEKKYDTGLRLRVMWLFPKGKHQDGKYKITKPDTDNLQKMLKDVMTKLGFWEDDALVASELVEKFWAEMPGLFISIRELDPCKWLHDEVCCNAESDECADFPSQEVCNRCKYFEV